MGTLSPHVQKVNDILEAVGPHKTASRLNRSGDEVKKALLVTTSMARGINEETFNQKYIKGTAVFNKHHGGKVNSLYRLMHQKMEKEQPDIVIFQAGGNDLSSTTRTSNPVSSIALANGIMAAGRACAKPGVTIGISSILPRADFHLQLKRQEINTLLQGMCVKNNFAFIDNSNIVLSEHILEDGVHLNNVGTELFSSNLLKFLNEGCT